MIGRAAVLVLVEMRPRREAGWGKKMAYMLRQELCTIQRANIASRQHRGAMESYPSLSLLLLLSSSGDGGGGGAAAGVYGTAKWSGGLGAPQSPGSRHVEETLLGGGGRRVHCISALGDLQIYPPFTPPPFWRFGLFHINRLK